MVELPIQNLDRIDIMGRRQDGGMDLAIVVSGPLRSEADHLRHLEQKIVTYIHAISSRGFSAEFPHVDTPRRILLVTEHLVDQAVLALLDSFRNAAAAAGAVLGVVTPEYFSRP